MTTPSVSIRDTCTSQDLGFPGIWGFVFGFDFGWIYGRYYSFVGVLGRMLKWLPFGVNLQAYVSLHNHGFVSFTDG